MRMENRYAINKENVPFSERNKTLLTQEEALRLITKFYSEDEGWIILNVKDALSKKTQTYLEEWDLENEAEVRENFFTE